MTEVVTDSGRARILPYSYIVEQHSSGGRWRSPTSLRRLAESWRRAKEERPNRRPFGRSR